MNVKLKQGIAIAILFFILIISGCENKEENPSVGEKTEMYLIKKDGKMGIIDKKGKVILEPRYDDISFNEKETKGTLIKAKSEGKYGFINLKGKWVIDPKYDNCGLFSNGLASVLINGRVGFIDTKGKVRIDFNYDVFPKARYKDYYKIYTFNKDGLCVVQKNGRFGVINKKGEAVIEPKYDEEFHFSEGVAAVKQGGVYGYIDNTGKVVIDFKYKSADLFLDGIAIVNDGRDKFIDIKGKEIFNREFESVQQFENGTAYVDFDKIIDKNGNTILDSNKEYNIRNNISEGLVLVWFKDIDKYGYVDSNGKKIFNAKYSMAYSFKNSFAAVMNKDFNEVEEYGFIDKNGNEVIKLKYDYVASFDENGIAAVYICDDEECKRLKASDKIDYILKNGKMGYIDADGKYIWDLTK